MRNHQFSVAVHLMAALGYRQKPVTSAELARSVNTNASFVRRVLAKLSKAQLVHATLGKTGACVSGRKPHKITLLDIYRSVDPPKAFAIHQYPVKRACPVSRCVKNSLEKVLEDTQVSLEKRLARIRLSDFIADLNLS
jgi:Rrf2 family protein